MCKCTPTLRQPFCGKPGCEPPAQTPAGERKIIAYALSPVYAPDPSDPPRLATAAVMECMATGRQLSGMGGGGDFLTPEIFDALRNDGRSKAVVLTDMYEQMERVVAAARQMPRATPSPGGASTEHQFTIPAWAVWALDTALRDLDAALPHQPSPADVNASAYHLTGGGLTVETDRGPLEVGAGYVVVPEARYQALLAAYRGAGHSDAVREALELLQVIRNSARSALKKAKEDRPSPWVLMAGLADAAEQGIAAISSAGEQGDGWKDIASAPSDETTIVRWHRVWKCPVAVQRNNGRIPGYPEWITATKDQTWPEEAFTPHFRPVTAPPASTFPLPDEREGA